MHRICLLTGILVALLASDLSAQLSLQEKKTVNTINATVRAAGKDFVAQKYDSSGKHIREAMKQISEAVKSGRPELFNALQPAINKVSKAHAMLDFEGVSLPPFVKPTRPVEMTKSSPPSDSSKPMPANPPPSMDPNAVSFTGQVAPILSRRCGSCHIQGSKGRFNLGTFAALMKGPPEGVVIFAGDTIGSRLIETIETGDMPRGGGKVSQQELAVLKAWINQGAKFDGNDPNAPISGGAAPTPQNNRNPVVRRATGKETVSFALDVAPLLVGNCNGCHINAMRNQGGLRMDNFAQILRGGDSGEIVIPGRSADSLLVKKLRGMGDGQRMPAGGRPALPEKDIQLIAKWIDEGATLDGAGPDQPIEVMAQLAWASNATSEQMNERRQQLASKNIGLVTSGQKPHVETTEHFFVVGTSAPGTIQLVAEKAEAHMARVKSLARGPSGDDYFHGKATIFVLPRRYDYSEFAKMIEQRAVPTDWSSHWKFDGVDAYAAMVATDRDEEEEISSRLLGPLTSLAVATRGANVPRWFADGIGMAVATTNGPIDRETKVLMQQQLSEALSNCKDAKTFLGNKLTPEQLDQISTSIGATMIDRKARKSFDACMRNLSNGSPFESAFAQAFRMPMNTWINSWLAYARR